MKKTFTFEVDFDEAVAMDTGSNLLTSLGISKERGDELLMHCIKRQDEISESGGDILNSLIEAVKFIEDGNLTGNEILFYIANGYVSMLHAHRIKEAALMSVLSSLVSDEDEKTSNE
jgi:hypothetical protein